MRVVRSGGVMGLGPETAPYQASAPGAGAGGGELAAMCHVSGGAASHVAPPPGGGVFRLARSLGTGEVTGAVTVLVGGVGDEKGAVSQQWGKK